MPPVTRASCCPRDLCLREGAAGRCCLPWELLRSQASCCDPPREQAGPAAQGLPCWAEQGLGWACPALRTLGPGVPTQSRTVWRRQDPAGQAGAHLAPQRLHSQARGSTQGSCVSTSRVTLEVTSPAFPLTCEAAGPVPARGEHPPNAVHTAISHGLPLHQVSVPVLTACGSLLPAESRRPHSHRLLDPVGLAPLAIPSLLPLTHHLLVTRTALLPLKLQLSRQPQALCTRCCPSLGCASHPTPLPPLSLPSPVASGSP